MALKTVFLVVAGINTSLFSIVCLAKLWLTSVRKGNDFRRLCLFVWITLQNSETTKPILTNSMSMSFSIIHQEDKTF